MLHAFATMNMEKRKRVEWELVPVHAMSRRTKVTKIRKRKKKTKKTGMKVSYTRPCAASRRNLTLLFCSSETIKVFDGNCSLRRRIFRAITVARTCTLEQLLTTALRAFHIAREPTVSFIRKLSCIERNF